MPAGEGALLRNTRGHVLWGQAQAGRVSFVVVAWRQALTVFSDRSRGYAP
jgi:hypothetical protein